MVSSAGKRALISVSGRFPIVLISGPVGSGKAALARHCFPGMSFIDLRNPVTRNIAAVSPRTFLMAFQNGAVIHEISLIPGMLEAVRYHVDRMGAGPGRFILTSTRQVDTGPVSENGFMDGRLGLLELRGMDIADLDAEKVSTYNPFRIILDGQLPKVLDGDRSPGDIVDYILDNLIRSCINVSNLPVFRGFLEVCARSCAQPFSMNALAREAGISAPTAKTWMTLLQEFNVLDLVGQCFFFTDTGILCHLLGLTTVADLILSPHRTCVVRTFALNELVRGRCSRMLERALDSGDDADFTARWRERYSMIVDPNIEVTRETKARVGRTDGNSTARKLVLYLGDVTYSMGSTDCISFRDWAKLAAGIDYFS